MREKILVLLIIKSLSWDQIESYPNGQSFQGEISSKLVQENIKLPVISQRGELPDTSTVSAPANQNQLQTNGSVRRYPVAEVDYERVQIPFVIGIWILTASIVKILFHMTPKLSHALPESCMLIIIGLFVGCLLRFGVNLNVAPLTSNTFFLYMLPPIILDAGYFMPNRMFFDNFGTIVLMAVAGTIFNILAIGCALWAFGLTGIYGSVEETPNFAATLLFSSVIAAVDPVAVLTVFEEIHVNELLHIIIFGESLLNDAVTIVVYHVMEVYNDIGIDNVIPQDILSGVASFFVVALGGTIIGIIWGFLTGFVTRFTNHVLIIEPLFVFIMAYLAYLNAEMFHMSGILAITFCGITMKNYVESNVANNSQITIRHALKMISNSAETVIFMLLGVATIQSKHLWNTWFVVLTVIFCAIFRIISVIVLTAIVNPFRLHRLTASDQIVMSFGGLRGAVAFALVLLVDERVIKQKDMFLTTTIVIIFFTVFLQGGTIKLVLKWLNIKCAERRELTMCERTNERFIDHLKAGLSDIIGNVDNNNVRARFRRFNRRYLLPILLKDLKKSERKLVETHAKSMLDDALVLMNHSTNLKYNKLFERETGNHNGFIDTAIGLNFVARNQNLPSFTNAAFTPDEKHTTTETLEVGPTFTAKPQKTITKRRKNRTQSI